MQLVLKWCLWQKHSDCMYEQDLVERRRERRNDNLHLEGPSCLIMVASPAAQRARRDISEPLWANGVLVAYVQHGCLQKLSPAAFHCHAWVLGTEQWIKRCTCVKVILWRRWTANSKPQLLSRDRRHAWNDVCGVSGRAFSRASREPLQDGFLEDWAAVWLEAASSSLCLCGLSVIKVNASWADGEKMG